MTPKVKTNQRSDLEWQVSMKDKIKLSSMARQAFNSSEFALLAQRIMNPTIAAALNMSAFSLPG